MKSPLRSTVHISLFTKLIILAIVSSILPLLFTTGLIIWLQKEHFWFGMATMTSITVFSLGAALMLARHISRPIQALLMGVERIGKGNFTTLVEVHTHDELQDLANAFNRMCEDMQRYSEVRVDEVVAEKAKIEGIIYSSEDGILLTDPEGHVQLINAKALSILGLGEESKEAVSGRPIWGFVKDDRLAVALRESIEGDRPKSARMIDLSQETIRRFYNMSISLVNAPEGSETAYWIVLALRNITAEKELEALKDDFLQSLTHDLRSPMTAIRGYLQVIGEEMAGPITPEQKKMIVIMEHASTKLLHIISNLLDSAKISAGKLRLALAEVDLRELAPPTVEILHSEAAKKHITMTLDMPEELTPLKLDPSLMERVIVNLISNAIKFTPDGGFVTIKFAELKDRMQIQVIDTGPGIPPEFMDRMFKRFEQVRGTRGGTGLGLSNCKNIVEAHHGEISVRSKVGEGTTFTFWIPKNLEQNERGDIFRAQPPTSQQQAAA